MAEPTSRYLHLRGATSGAIRTAKYRGRPHLVLPVVALVEGVVHAINAETPEFVPASELSRAPQGWNGRPVVPGHPRLNGAATGTPISANDPAVLESQAFGRVFNARVDGGRLLMEAWLDPERAARCGPAAQSVIDRVKTGKMVEVSVGAFITAENTAGEHRGKPYKAVWRDIVPDHLAMLPDGALGACSIEMGCGAPRHLVTAEGYDVRDAAEWDESKHPRGKKGDPDGGKFTSGGGGGSDSESDSGDSDDSDSPAAAAIRDVAESVAEAENNNMSNTSWRDFGIDGTEGHEKELDAWWEKTKDDIISTIKTGKIPPAGERSDIVKAAADVVAEAEENNYNSLGWGDFVVDEGEGHEKELDAWWDKTKSNIIKVIRGASAVEDGGRSSLGTRGIAAPGPGRSIEPRVGRAAPSSPYAVRDARYRALLDGVDVDGDPALRSAADGVKRAKMKSDHPFTYCKSYVVPAIERKGRAVDDPDRFCGWWKHDQTFAAAQASSAGPTWTRRYSIAADALEREAARLRGLANAPAPGALSELRGALDRIMAEWDESKHPRHPKGDPSGGKFAPSSGGGDGSAMPRHPEMPPTEAEIRRHQLSAEVEDGEDPRKYTISVKHRKDDGSDEVHRVEVSKAYGTSRTGKPHGTPTEEQAKKYAVDHVAGIDDPERPSVKTVEVRPGSPSDLDHARDVTQIMKTSALVSVVAGRVDLNRLAKAGLADRGMDAEGRWVGFDRAAKIHGIAAQREADKPEATDAREVLQLFNTSALARAARGEMDLNRMAREEMASRGFDRSGKWVGFDRAARIHGTSRPARPAAEPAWKGPKRPRRAEAHSPRHMACSCGGRHADTASSSTAVTIGENMTRSERIRALIDCPKTPFTEDDLSMLEAASDDRLVALAEFVPPAPEPEKKEEPQPPAPVAPAPDAAQPVPAAIVTADAYIAAAPPELQESLREGMRASQEKRSGLISALRASGRCEFTDAELAAHSTSDLTRLVKLSAVPVPDSPVDFSGKGVPRAASADDGVPAAPSVADRLKK